MVSALVLTAMRIFLADVSQYRAELETRIQQVTQMPIHVGKLSGNMHYFSPRLVLQDISIDSTEAGAEPALKLKEVRIGVDLWHLLLTGDVVASSKVALLGVKADVVRNPDGGISINGLQSNGEPPLWLMLVRQYQVLQSDISWQDLKNNGKQLTFRSFDLILKNNGDSHEIHLLTTLNEKYGDSLRISALIKGNLFAVDDLDAQLYVEGVNLQAPALISDDLPLSYQVQSGSGDVRIWSQWRHSRPYRIAGYLQAQQINVANAEGKNLRMDTLSGNVSWLAKPGGWRLGVYDMDVYANGQFWSDAEFYLQNDEQGNWAGLIKQVNLQALSHIGPLFIPAENQYAHWQQLNPGGQLSNLAFYVQPNMQHYALQGGFRQLSVNAVDSVPGLQGISGTVSGSDGQGQIEFASENVQLDAPMFRNSLTIKDLQGQIDWRQQEENWYFSSQGLVVNSPDFDTTTEFQVTLPKNQAAPYVDMRMRFGNLADVSRLPHYYPAKLMDKDAVKWLDQAFIAGRVDHGEMLLRGSLDQFPFDNGQGLFETFLAVENGELQYHPDWPHAKDLSADVQYLGQDLKVAIHGGNGDNVNIKQMLVTINSLPVSEHAELTGQVQSNLQNALLFLQKTPLNPQVEPLLKLVKLESNAVVDLDLSIPYHEHMAFGVNVNAHLHDAELLFKPVDLAFNNINGILHFTENQISSQQLTAQLLGSPVQGNVSTDNTAIHLQAEGSSSVDALQKQFVFLKNDIAKGNFSYKAELTVPHLPNQPQTLNVSSSLQGVTVDSNDFLSKTSDEQRPFSLDFQFNNKPLLPFKIHYGKDLNAALLVDLVKNSLYSGHVVAGQHEADFEERAGLNVEIKQPEFRVSQAASALSAEDDHWPTLQELRLETDNLIWQGQNLGSVHCHFLHDDQAWRGDVDSVMAKGQIIIPDQRYGNEPIKLEMDYLNVSAINSLKFNAAEQVVESLPLIAVDSQQLIWRSVNLGKLTLQSERRNNGVHFKTITLSDANKTLDFNADWIKLPQGSSTLISGTLKVDDFGRFLSELGYSDDFKETHADIGFSGGWSDTPQQFSLERLHGQLQVKLNDGRISSIEPGLGRLLGLISMEQWAKRLSLDFTDIYRQGLAFNKITGDFRINNGVAFSDNLLVDAVVARMRITGTANLINKTLDQDVIVIPKSSDALPIAGTIVGGVAEFITNVVTNDYKEGYFFGSEYKIAGHWGSVEVTPVDEHEGLMNKTLRGLTDFGWLK
jgi:uncharacterized protein (TIGR02099 family)